MDVLGTSVRGDDQAGLAHIDAFLPGGLDGIQSLVTTVTQNVFGKLVVLGSGRAHEERPHLGARGQ